MRRAILAPLILCSGCGTAPQPEPPAAAVEVPLPSQRDRDDFIAMMRQSAVAHDFHADAATPSEIARLNGVSPITVNVAVWRGTDDDEIVASGMDGLDHVGRVWLSFEKGSEPQQFALFRTDLLRQVKRKWPGTRPLPIMPSGAIPLPSDLIRTSDGYKVKAASEPSYRK